MRTRSAAARVVLAACTAFLIGVSAVWAVPPGTFTSPIRLGFAAGDDWEPSIAADRYGHVYALWTHYIGFGGGSSGEIDPSCP
ncbi:MAG: hypothetical protein ACREKB_06520, partial [Candidatus Rokuibacteriota bacterium]